MKKIYHYLIATLSVLAFGAAISAHAASTNSNNTSKDTTPTLAEPELEVGQKTISGQATKGVTITVRAYDSKKTKITSTTASNNGNYTVKLPKSYSEGTKLYVYAQQKGSYKYFYRIVNVKAKGFYEKNNSSSSNSSKNSSTTNKNGSTKTNTSTSKANDPKISVKEPTGTWKSSAINGSYTEMTFSQTTGFNETTYKNNKKVKNVVTNASYQVLPQTNAFWEIKYKQHGDKSYSTMYITFDSNSQFHLTNAKNQVTNGSNDNVFTLTK